MLSTYILTHKSNISRLTYKLNKELVSMLAKKSSSKEVEHLLYPHQHHPQSSLNQKYLHSCLYFSNTIEITYNVMLQCKPKQHVV